MSIKGLGAVAIWHDIAAEGLDEFYAWHGQEHMPERVAIPGFIRGRRFIAIEADREFFNLYETRDESVVKSDAYKARLDDPTPWTVATVRHFRAVARTLSRVEATLGAADGGLVATLRYDLPLEAEAAHAAALRAGPLPKLAALPGIAAIHLIAADREASGYVNAEQKARGAANETPSHALIVEGWADEAALRDALASLDIPGPAVLGFYRHQITVG